MSVRVTALVWQHFPRGGSDLLVMLALADFGNDAGNNIRPSARTLAKKVRLSRRQAQKVLRQLEADGWIATVSHTAGGPQQATRRYKINLDKLRATPVAEDTPTRVVDDTGVAGNTGVAGDHDGCRGGHRRVSPVTPEPLRTVNEPTVLHVDSKPSTCPHDEIVKLYHDHLPSCRQVRVWNATRKGYLKARWSEDPERQHPEWWKAFFNYVGKSDFLTGRTNGTGDRPPFTADLEWLLRPANFVKVIEGKYHREGDV